MKFPFMNETLERSPHKVLVDTFFLTALAFILFYSFYFLFPLGVMLSMFSPLPLIFIYLTRGQRVGVSVCAFLVLAFTLIGGWATGILFFIQNGLISVVLGESFRKRYPAEPTVLAGVVLSAVAAGLVLFLTISFLDLNIADFIKNQIQANINQNLQNYREMDPKNVAVLEEYSNSVISVIVSAFPSIFVVATASTVLMNYLAFKFVWLRVHGEEIGDTRNPTHWTVSDHLIWGFIASGLFMLLPNDTVRTIGLNGLILTISVYLTLGVSIFLFYLDKGKVPGFYRILFLGFILMTPFFIVFIAVLAGLGLFDMWADFRKLRKPSVGPRPSAEPPNENFED